MAASREKFLLCFHDFGIENAKITFPIIKRIKEHTGFSFPVLVIPDISKGNSEQISEFSNMLKELSNEKFELLIHGFSHKSNNLFKRNWQGKIANALANHEAEFAGLSKEDSSSLLHQSINSWNHLNLSSPTGFVAPTWHGNKFLKKHVLNHGLIFEERFFIHSLKGKKIFSPVASFAGIPSSFVPMVFAFGKLSLCLKNSIPRIALHPVDFPKWEQKIFTLIDEFLKKREPVFYKNL